MVSNPTFVENQHVRTITRKKEGFKGQKAVVIPRKILSELCKKNEVIKPLYITDIGYYPNAQFHYRKRPDGADQHILIFCYEGNGRAVIDNNEYRIEPGEFFFIPTKTSHLYEADKKNPWTIYWVHFTGTASNAIIAQFEKKFSGNKNFLQNSEQTISLFDKLYSQMERGYSTDNLVYSNMCLWQYLATFLFNNKYDLSGKLEYKSPVDMAIDFLKTKTDRLLTLEEIAGAVNLSASHFSYLFKNKTGFSPIEYFNHLKIQKACQYLLFTTKRVKEISLELGIEDPYYFSRMFKKIMGMSPDIYRGKKNPVA